MTPSMPTGYGNQPTPGGTESGAPGDENDVLKHLTEALAGLSEAERQRLLAMLVSKRVLSCDPPTDRPGRQRQ